MTSLVPTQSLEARVSKAVRSVELCGLKVYGVRITGRGITVLTQPLDGGAPVNDTQPDETLEQRWIREKVAELGKAK